jgi:hypothetical protein
MANTGMLFLKVFGKDGDFWYTTRKAYKAIQGHEVLKNDPQRGKWVHSYWDMDEEENSNLEEIAQVVLLGVV